MSDFKWDQRVTDRVAQLPRLGNRVLFLAVRRAIDNIEVRDMPLNRALEVAHSGFSSERQRDINKEELDRMVRHCYPQNYFLKRARKRFGQSEQGRKAIKAKIDRHQLDRQFKHSIAGD